ncbi:MAG: winged helix-turn-helix domain-containing protein [Bacillota bacterium]
MKYPWIEDFLRLRNLDSKAKCVYLTACLEPMSLADLTRATGLSRNCVKARVRSLVEAGWIVLRLDGRKKLALPTAPQAVQQKYAEILKVRLSMAMYRGEAQMKLLLDTIVVSRNFVENARPDFLKSPVTSLNLEVDRLYPEVAGFEYLGAQHMKPYAAFGGQAKYETTRLNDLIKAGMTVEANIELVHVVKVDLTIEGMQRLIPPKMKTWPLVEGPYLRTVRETCADYMKMETGDPPRRP